MNANGYKYLLFLTAFVLVLTFMSANLGFFWDNVLLSSKLAHFYFENGWNGLIPADSVDCGHPPFFGVYLAAGWNLLGKHLWVSHLLMLPFLFILIYHYYKIVEYFLPAHFQWAGIAMFVFEPSLIAQCTMVSNEVVQIICFVWAVSLIIRIKYWQLIFPTILITSVSMRGVFVVVGLFLAHFLLETIRNKKINFKSVVYYLPSAVFFLIWNYYHFVETGWVFQNIGSRWATEYGTSGVKEVVRNFVVVAWHFVDFGRIALWILLIFPGVYLWKNWIRKSKSKDFLIVLLATMAPLFFFLLSRDIPIGHRYFAGWYLLFALGVMMLLAEWENRKARTIAVIVSCVLLLSGNLWTYPDKIAQGWDSTLGYVPYFDLRDEMLSFMKEENIPFENVAAGYTMHASSKHIMLAEAEEVFLNKQKSWDQAQYIWYSNAVNGFSDEEIDELRNEWILLKDLRRWGVKHQLYKRK